MCGCSLLYVFRKVSQKITVEFKENKVTNWSCWFIKEQVWWAQKTHVWCAVQMFYFLYVCILQLSSKNKRQTRKNYKIQHMDQYIYKTFKMLQNGLYWSFYYCSSIWIFIQIVKLGCFHHFAQFYNCQGETSRGHIDWKNHEKPPPPTTNRRS